MTLLKENNEIENDKLKIYLYAIGLPALVSLLPIAFDMYGPGYGGNCWIKIEPDHELKAVIWSLSIFYIPLWVAIII